MNKAQEALSSDNLMIQYHAMGILYRITSTTVSRLQDGHQADQVLPLLTTRLLLSGRFYYISVTHSHMTICGSYDNSYDCVTVKLGSFGGDKSCMRF